MSVSIFEFVDYKLYLREQLPTRGDKRGCRRRLAERIRCKPSFVTQVLNGKVHFSLEHVIEIDRFFSHSPQESQYFMLMAHHGRAGSRRLESFFLEQMELVRQERSRVTNQVDAHRLPDQVIQRYYSSWIYSAAHVLLMIPGGQTPEQMERRLHLPRETVVQIVGFLRSAGLIEEKGGRLLSTSRRVHLNDDSLMIANHHTNWNLRAAASLASTDPADLHYSGPITLSRHNAQRVRAMLLQFIRDLDPILAETEEEAVYALSIDLFAI